MVLCQLKQIKEAWAHPCSLKMILVDPYFSQLHCRMNLRSYSHPVSRKKFMIFSPCQNLLQDSVHLWVSSSSGRKPILPSLPTRNIFMANKRRCRSLPTKNPMQASVVDLLAFWHHGHLLKHRIILNNKFEQMKWWHKRRTGCVPVTSLVATLCTHRHLPGMMGLF